MNFTEFLNQVPSFSDFSQEEIHILAQAMATSEFPEDHVFVKEGKSADGLYLIVKGEVIVTRERDDHGVDILERLVNGELFGLISLIDHGVRSATCTAATKVTAAYLPKAAFQMLYESHTRLGYHFQHMIARQLTHDIRNYTEDLIHGIVNENKYHTYEAIGSNRNYKGTERRKDSRRTTDRRDNYKPRISQ